MVTKFHRDTMLQLEADAIFWFISLVATILLSTMVVTGSIVYSGPCKVTSFEARDVWQYRVVDDVSNSSVDVLRQEHCRQCNAWPLHCCSNETFNNQTTTLFLNVELSDCFDDDCTRLVGPHAYAGSWNSDQQRQIRTLLQPNVTLTCYWNKWDGHKPYRIENDITYTILPWAVIVFTLLMMSSETYRRYQEAKFGANEHVRCFAVSARWFYERLTLSHTHID